MRKLNGRSLAPIDLIAAASLAICGGSALAQMKGGDHSQHGGQDKGGGGGKGQHAGHGMMGHHPPGSVQPMCHGEHGDMPPHYCDPVFKVVSSIPGVQVGEAKVLGEKAVSVTLRSSLASNPKMVVVGGAGGLAGASVVAAGWRDGVQVTLTLQGSDTVYAHRGMHIHLFPLTDK